MSFKIREQILLNHLSDSCSEGCVADLLTSLGLESEVVEEAFVVPSSVVIGKIVSMSPHPNADKLNVCSVSVDNTADNKTIVCGCKTAREGMVVPVALPGTVLPKGTIEEAELRGVMSSGMLCSAQEVGLQVQSSGLLRLSDDAPLGVPLADYLDLSSPLVEVDLTPNRVDCASALGLTRELAAKLNTSYDCQFPHQDVDFREAEKLFHCDSSLAACALVSLSNIKNSGSTPAFVIARLNDSGINLVNPVVDILNYTMIMTGQPMHAYNRDVLKLPLSIGPAKDAVTFTTLKDDHVQLSASDWVVRDEAEVHSLAGVMGSSVSGVNASTHSIVIEAAAFPAQSVAATVLKHNIHTDSSYRFERGTDPNGVKSAIQMAVALLQKFCQGQVVEAEAYYSPLEPSVIAFRPSHFASLIGVSVDQDRMLSILRCLHFDVQVHGDHLWEIQSPSYRVDIHESVDVIEEICRFIGYDNLIASDVNAVMSSQCKIKMTSHRDLCLKQRLLAHGFSEMIGYSFLSKELLETFGYNDHMMIKNPINSNFAAMRPSLLPAMIINAEENLRHGERFIKTFEMAKTYHKEGAKERLKLGVVVSGQGCLDHWSIKSYNSSIFKQEILQVLPELESFKIESNERLDYLNANASLSWVNSQGEVVGSIGLLHPGIASKIKMKQKVWAFEIDLGLYFKEAKPKRRRQDTHPDITQDITFSYPTNKRYSDIENHIMSMDHKYLIDIDLIDAYTGGQSIPEGCKQLTIRLTFNGGYKNLTDEDIANELSLIRSLLSSENMLNFK
ncbi:MAG: phenylalanine--tRNA ligase subunit beta [Candidatus Comchoanobacterales bacterium]